MYVIINGYFSLIMVLVVGKLIRFFKDLKIILGLVFFEYWCFVDFCRWSLKDYSKNWVKKWRSKLVVGKDIYIYKICL